VSNCNLADKAGVWDINMATTFTDSYSTYFENSGTQGGVYRFAQTTGDITISNCEFRGNFGQQGGVINAESFKSLTITSNEFIYNYV